MTILPIYEEPFSDYDDLTKSLQERGLDGSQLIIKEKLSNVGYKRLSGYWGHFLDFSTRQINCDIDTLWKLYRFDRRLRFLILDAIERIEVGIRSRLVHYFAKKYGAYGHLDELSFHESVHPEWKRWLAKQKTQTEKSKKSRGSSAAVFYANYSNSEMPLWVLCELFDFGSTFTFFRIVDSSIRKSLAADLGLKSYQILASWLGALNDVRNACAHHEKVWNRQWAKRPQLPKHRGVWHLQFDADNQLWTEKLKAGQNASFKDNWTGVFLTICNYLLRYLAPSSQWNERLVLLLNADVFIPNLHESMGLPPYWTQHPLWKSN